MAKTDLRKTGVRGGRATVAKGAKYSAGWLAIPGGGPDEDLIRLGGFAWSELYVGADTKRIFKQIKNTGEWFRFAFVEATDMRAEL